jgi:excisionase family DNA binding protein
MHEINGTGRARGSEVPRMKGLIEVFLTSRNEFLTVKEAADLLGKGQTTIRTWIDTGKLQALRVGGTLYVYKGSLRQVIEDLS